ncbi:transcription termination factor 5, mitochondrial [Amyelois transitella]|uniref:transcription termination factor 5, mitochondrial n=1 Tax=Amyelois transitella TaxID=680683 RepID=UPI0029906D2B|nr:transcription termination factor 5, mitochondrial [Amyelois transitella]
MILGPICRTGLSRAKCLYTYTTRRTFALKNEDVVKSLQKYLNVTESAAQYLCIKHSYISKLDDSKIKDVIDGIYHLGFRKEDLVSHPILFLLHPVTLKFRYKVLQECGFSNIKPTHIVSYLNIVKRKTINELKESGDIYTIINLENRLASFMTQWPTSLTNVIDGDIGECSLYSLRIRIIGRYLELVLDLAEDEFNRGLKTYPTIKHRPLGAINETISILQSQIMMPAHKIKSNLYLLQLDPDNLKDIIVNFRSIGGIDIKEVIRMHPKIAMKNCSILFEIRKVLQDFGISNEAQRRCFDIYTLGPNTIRERIEYAKTIPEFITFYHHPRFLKMIHYKKTAIERLQHLYGNNKKCVSLNILSGSAAHFEVFEKSPGDRLGKGKDLVFYVSQSLGKEYLKSDIHRMLKRHPFWINIPLVQVKYVYERLSKDFSNKDIFENCPIVLYPWSKIKEAIDYLNTSHSITTHLHDNLDLMKLSQSQKLSIVLYYLEKNHYFSGNGVWGEEKSNKVIVDKPHLQDLKNVHMVQCV